MDASVSERERAIEAAKQMILRNPAISTHYSDCWEWHPLCLVGYLATLLAATPNPDEGRPTTPGATDE